LCDTDASAKQRFVAQVAECDDINQLIIPEQQIALVTELGEGKLPS